LTEPPPEFDAETAVTVGRILAPHGIRGEVKVEVLTDFPERFDPGATLWIDGAPIRVEASRAQGKAFLLRLQGIDGRSEAETLRGRELMAPRLDELGADTYYRDDLIGFSVVNAQGEGLGELADIFSTGSNDVYVVRGPRGELLLPATDDVVLEVDLPSGRLVVEVIEGLEWTAPKAPRRAMGQRKTPGSSRTRA
jgi:16S rRNA processing protein RimM